MFRRLHEAPPTLTVFIDGAATAAHEGDTVAAVLLNQTGGAFRTTAVSGSARAPYCMMGVCFDCLVTIDGQLNRQGCLTLVRDGMRIDRQNGARSVA